MYQYGQRQQSNQDDIYRNPTLAFGKLNMAQKYKIETYQSVDEAWCSSWRVQSEDRFGGRRLVRRKAATRVVGTRRHVKCCFGLKQHPTSTVTTRIWHTTIMFFFGLGGLFYGNIPCDSMVAHPTLTHVSSQSRYCWSTQ
jgi:hypothetical protein